MRKNMRLRQAMRQDPPIKAGVGTAALQTARHSQGLPVLVCAVVAGLIVAACAQQKTPTGIEQAHFNHNSAAHDDKGYLDGWFDGGEVQLHYTKTYFCAEPPASGAASNCVLGADAEIAPRPGPIPTIYAIAAAGFSPDPSTLSCPGGSVCLNHPAMIDASRVAGAGATSVPGAPHSHMLEERAAGWHHTVNIRVFSLAVWNQIVTAKSIARVRELQADPAVGGAGLISRDTPTNIFFFIQPQQDK